MKTTRTNIKILGISFVAISLGVSAAQERGTNRIAMVLQAFAEGRIPFASVEIDDNKEDRLEAIRYFESRSNGVPDQAKIVLSKCYFLERDFTNALRLANDYTKSYSNDWRGWSMVGAASVKLDDLRNAVRAYTNAVMLGDEDSYAPLAVAAVASDRLDIVRDIVPHLLILKQAPRTPQNFRMQITGALVMYSINANQEDVFVKALEGISAEEILSREDITKAVILGWREFHSAKVRPLCEEVQRKRGNVQFDRKE